MCVLVLSCLVLPSQKFYKHVTAEGSRNLPLLEVVVYHKHVSTCFSPPLLVPAMMILKGWIKLVDGSCQGSSECEVCARGYISSRRTDSVDLMYALRDSGPG